MLLIKKVLLTASACLVVQAGSFESVMTAGNNISMQKQKFDKKSLLRGFNYYKDKPIQSLRAIEAIMVGVAYTSGIPEIELKQDLNKGATYFKQAYKKGSIEGAYYYLENLLRLNKLQEAIFFVEKVFRDPKEDNYLKQILLQQLSGYLLLVDEFEKAFLYIRLLADYFKMPFAKIYLSTMYYQGVGVEKNLDMAKKYFNAGCSSEDLNDYAKAYCKTLKDAF
jgi:TPR repeat protein